MSADTRQRGAALRAQVLGDRPSPATASDDFLQPYRELSLEVAWGSLWSRGVLPIKTRRFLTLILLAQQSRPRELEMHVRAALADGCTAEEIREVFMHAISYCGFPAAGEAMAITAKILAEPPP